MLLLGLSYVMLPESTSDFCNKLCISWKSKNCVILEKQYSNIRGGVITEIAVALYKNKESNFGIFRVKSV